MRQLDNKERGQTSKRKPDCKRRVLLIQNKDFSFDSIFFQVGQYIDAVNSLVYVINIIKYNLKTFYILAHSKSLLNLMPKLFPLALPSVNCRLKPNQRYFSQRKRYFYFESQQSFGFSMDKQENFGQPLFEYEGDNLLFRWLNYPNDRKDMLQLDLPTNLKDNHIPSEEENEQSRPQVPFKDILDKEEPNYNLPQNFYQEQAEENILIVTPSTKRIESEGPTSIRKESKFDKMAYQEETRSTKIQRYLQKKSRRIWGRKVSYDCRKIVADNRERVNGRFVKKSSLQSEKGKGRKPILANEQLQMMLDDEQIQKQRRDFIGHILD